MHEAVPIAVHLLPSLIPSGALRGGIAVVLDVLRASTMIVHALAAGCDAVMPCVEVDEARRLARSLAPGTALLAGERHGVPIEGFDLGNSPRSCIPERCRGKSLCFTTTNGTRAILATLESERVVVGSFPNFRATLELVLDDRRPVHVVCSGTEGEVSFEDTLLAGALVHALSGERAGVPINDPARIAEQFWQARLRDDRPLADILALGRGGRRVTELGLRDDIEAAAEVDSFRLVAELDHKVTLEAPQTGTPQSTLPHKGGGDWPYPLRIVARR
jgi:2-phosphosulfolactate phosphatase